jgi:hypothetical protein
MISATNVTLRGAVISMPIGAPLLAKSTMSRPLTFGWVLEPSALLGGQESGRPPAVGPGDTSPEVRAPSSVLASPAG